MDLDSYQVKVTRKVGSSLKIDLNVKQTQMGKARLCVVLKSAQGLNINKNPKLYFAVKLSHWLKGGMWVLVIIYDVNNPAANLAC